jgi:hypothetical protein
LFRLFSICTIFYIKTNKSTNKAVFTVEKRFHRIMITQIMIASVKNLGFFIKLIVGFSRDLGISSLN